MEESGDPIDPETGEEQPPPVQPIRRSGGVLGAAMLGLQYALYGPPKDEPEIAVEASGDPPNLDTDGLDDLLTDGRSLVGPPLDQIKARATPRRRARPRHR